MNDNLLTVHNIGPKSLKVSKTIGGVVADYDIINEGDKIMVAVSGGKDSLALLDLLLYRRTFAPVNFELMAVYVDMSMPGFPVDTLVDFFESREVQYHIEKVDLQGLTWDKMNCYWCSWNRRKALFLLAERTGFNKIAFGHHLDDIVETILMNQFLHAEISAMRPYQEMFGGKLKLIRPLAYAEEREIIAMAQERGYPQIDKKKCPLHEKSQRLVMRRWLAPIAKEYPAVKKNIMNSLKNINKEYLL
jgi:tRNA 2-thiocytidine biosynthesis protein TtcA